MNLDFGHWLAGRLSGMERVIGAAGPVLSARDARDGS